MNAKFIVVAGLIASAAIFIQTRAAQAENLNPHLLGAGCVVCHGPGGDSVGHIPALNTMNKVVIKTRLDDFKNDRRANTIMAKIAKGYTDKQIDVLAAYFGKN